MPTRRSLLSACGFSMGSVRPFELIFRQDGAHCAVGQVVCLLLCASVCVLGVEMASPAPARTSLNMCRS